MSWDEGISGIVKEAVQRDTSKVKVIGGPGTGKTLVLQRRVIRMLESGVAPKDIAVFVTNPTAAQLFANALLASGAPGAADVVVSTAHDYMVKVLNTPEAIKATGRYPRIISEFEYKLLAEDMKVLGTRPKRLKEMLKFFYKEWSEMGDDKDDFIMVDEERETLEALKNHLISRGAMLEEELGDICAHYLRDTRGAKEANAIKHVLVDDFQNLSRASQTALRLLSGETFCIAANPNQVNRGAIEQYPYPQGVADLLTKNEFKLERSLRLPQRMAAGCNALAMLPPFDKPCMVGFEQNDPMGNVQVVRWENSEAEFAGLVKYLSKRFANEEDELQPGDVMIIVPNKVWGKNLIKRFAAKRVKTSALLANQSINGNPKEMDKCNSARVLAALNIIADPYDAVAWRTWCGCGDYLTFSGAWCRLENFAADQQITVIDALDAISKMPEPLFLEANKLGERYTSGCDLIEKLGKCTGFTLLNKLAAEVLGRGSEFPHDVEELFAPVIGDEDAKTFFGRAFPQLINPKFVIDRQYLRIGTYPMMAGQSAKMVVLAGFINGFVPCRDVFDPEVAYNMQDRYREETRVAVYNAIGSARESLIISYFQKETVETAEPLKMQIHRIRAEQGQRMALMSPSIYIDEMGGSMPGPIDGAHLK